MKPDVKTAMEDLIKEARQRLPLRHSFNNNCEGRCEECPFKLLEYLDMDLSNWEEKLKKGDKPNIDDLYILANDCKRIRDILEKQGLLKNEAL
jgi:hypothetical protein